MKRLVSASLAIVGALSLGVAPAFAASVLFTDVISLHQCLSAAAPTACNGDGAPSLPSKLVGIDVSGYQAGSVITAAELTISLADDFGQGDGSEKIGVTLDDVSYVTNADANHDVVITFADFGDLLDGHLDVLLRATHGDFFVEGATLKVWDDPPVSPEGPTGGSRTGVPGPGPLVLLAGGMAGLTWVRRRR